MIRPLCGPQQHSKSEYSVGEAAVLIGVTAFTRIATKTQKTPPGGPGGASGASAYSPFFLRLRDQIRVKPSPSSSSNRLAKIGALKLGSSSLSER